jgi:class 3 adenylate cyclase/tetratricopeptide (TPR) repeat protein
MLFADIKGSMDLIEDLDPEEARAIVDPALKVMMEAVQRYGGYVAQPTGDGIFALFGAPVAHEDHARRALLAALRMQAELKGYSNRIRGEGRLPIQARVGVNTGEVVVRSITTGEGRTEYAPVGHSTGIAARMQTLAPVGSIAATEQVRKLCEGYFLFESLGPTKVKGVSEPVNVYEVTGLGPLRTRLQRASARGYTKFIGRDHEMEALRRAAEQAQAGHGQIVSAVAEPGVGKSRLFHEFKATSQSGWMLLETVSFSHDQASAYVPVVDLLSRYFDIEAGDDGRKRREKVAGKISILDRALEDTLPYLYGLLGLIEGNDPLAGMDAPIRRQRTLEALKRILLRESLNQPLMVIFEDLHWIDEETQGFLNLLADSIGTAKILLLVNYRLEYSPSWSSKSYYTQLRLDPLGKESAGEMLDALLGVNTQTMDGQLATLKRLIIEKTEGNPLFMEEIVQALTEEGVLVRNGAVKLTRPLAALKVPPTVQDIIASRIDRLPAAEKELLQTLAVIGVEFTLALAGEVTKKPDDELNQRLNDLQLAEFIYEQPRAGDIEYKFKHTHIQEVAYNSVLMERRRLLHERAGEVIEHLFAERLNDHLNELARHFSRSANTAKALTYLYLAGQQAAGRSAYGEAVAHYTRGLELLKSHPDDPERARCEVDLRIALADSFRWTQGIGAEEIRLTLIRARELCERLGENTKLFAVLQRIQTHRGIRRLDPRSVRNSAEQLVTLAEAANDPDRLMIAHGSLGMELFSIGEFGTALKHLEQAGPSLDWTKNFGVFYPSGGSWALWALGYSDRALKWCREALTAAEALSRPELLASSLILTAHLHTFMRDPRMARQYGEAAVALATEHGLPYENANGSFVRGWALAWEGHLEEGVAQMRHAKASLEAQGVLRPRSYSFLAEACAKLESPNAALELVEQGIASVEMLGEHSFEAELQRVKGELLLMQGVVNAAEGENCFRTAIEVARRQGGKSLELRAATSLARLMRDTDRRDEARKMLADIYNWFTEGFDTADLKDAKALLEELA